MKAIPYLLALAVFAAGMALIWHFYKLADTVPHTIVRSRPVVSGSTSIPRFEEPGVPKSDSATRVQQPGDGKHPLTELPPCTPEDVVRQTKLGFSQQEIIFEIRRRGFVGFSSAESRQTLVEANVPANVLTELEKIENLLTPDALARYGRRFSYEQVDHVKAVQAANAEIATLMERYRVSPSSIPWQIRKFLGERAKLVGEIEQLRKERITLLGEGKPADEVGKKLEDLEKKLSEMTVPEVPSATPSPSPTRRPQRR